MPAKLLIDIPTINWAYTVILETENEYSFGTSRDSTVKLPPGSAAERHAIMKFENSWVISDLQSPSGTLVNDKAIDKHPLRDQDILKIGKCEIVFQNPGEATGTRQWNHTHQVAQARHVALNSVVSKAESGTASPGDLEFIFSRDWNSTRDPASAGETPAKTSAVSPDVVWVAQKLSDITSAVLMIEGDREETYQLMLRHLREAINADNGFVMIPDPSNMRWIIRAWVGDSSSWTSYEKSHPLPLTVTNRAFRNMAVVSNALPDPNAVNDDEEINSASLQQLKVSSYIAVPLIQNKQRRGVLYFDTRTQDRKFLQRDVRLLELAGKLILEIEDDRK